MNMDAIEKLFKVQATIDHVLLIKRADALELSYLLRANEMLHEAIREIAKSAA